MNRGKWKFKIFYDADCPICRAEVRWLKRKDKLDNLLAVNISDPLFDAAIYGKSRDELMTIIHGVYPDGHIVSGIDAVIELYRTVGFGWLFIPAKITFIRPFYDLSYRWFARYRFRRNRYKNLCEKGRCNFK